MSDRESHPESGDALPHIVAPLGADQAIEKLSAASKRGKLAGFEKGVGNHLFEVAAFGAPFDKVLELREAPAQEGQLRLAPTLRLPMKLPAIFAVVLVLAVWPGEPLTDSLLRTYFGFYNGWTHPDVDGAWLRTWMWYYPLTVPSCFFAWRSSMKKTKASTSASAHEMLAKIASLLGGETKPAHGERG